MTSEMPEPCAVEIYGTQMWLLSLEILLILGSSKDLDKRPYRVDFYLFIFFYRDPGGVLSIKYNNLLVSSFKYKKYTYVSIK